MVVPLLRPSGSAVSSASWPGSSRPFTSYLSRVDSKTWMPGTRPGMTNLSLHPFRAALDGDDAGARDLDQAERNHQVDEALDLLGGAGDLEHEALGARVDDTGAERVGEPQRLDPVVALAAHLDHGELALDRRTGHRHVDHPMHRHQPLELILD